MNDTEKILGYWALMEKLSSSCDFPESENKKKIEDFEKIRETDAFKKDKDYYLCYHEDFLKDDKSDIKKLESYLYHYENEFEFCVGKIPKEALISSFKKKLEEDDDRPENAKGNLYLFSFKTDKDGNYQEKSFCISSFILGLNQIMSYTKPDRRIDIQMENELYKPDNQEEKYRNILESGDDLKEKICNLYEKLKNDYLSFLSDEYLAQCSNEVIKFHYFFKNENDCAELIDDIKAGKGFMGSLFLSDLEMVYDNYKKDSLVDRYINALKFPFDENKIIDVNENIDIYKELLSYENTPLAKWKSKRLPMLMQQVAINCVTSGYYPLFSVNGPPGTGKTTLLKEIIAQKVYECALAMSKYKNPDDAFIHKKDSDGIIEWYALDRSLTDFGILVSSSNNTAVENISLELPESDEQENEEIYFTKLAKNLLKRKQDKKEKEKKLTENKKSAWGLISVPLGKQSNLIDFYECCGCKFKEYKIDGNIEYLEARKKFLEQKEKVEKNMYMFSRKILHKRIKRICKSLKTEKDCKEYEEYQKKAPWNIYIKQNDNDSDDKEWEGKDIKKLQAFKQLNEDRERLFYMALDLRKKFICSTKYSFKNMELLFKIWKLEKDESLEGKLNSKKIERVFNDLFQTLFLFVPVISTTFASVGRMLRYMKEAEQIGMLVIDEAGQASPYFMVGALYRSKRAVVVGDPKQVEPVVTVPSQFSLIADKNGIGKYGDFSLSVQSFADKLNPIGCYLEKGNKNSWIGCPLKVHFRCIDPMFTISNKLSYNSSMVGMAKEVHAENVIGDSCWFDMAGEDNGKDHSVDSQTIFVIDKIKEIKKKIEEIKKKIEETKDKEGEKKFYENKIFVISPFTTVVNKIQRGLKNEGITDIECGTVHKFQGKQAEEVFFVLGCSEKSKSAVRWVNSNIVNVAVTRAMIRLYVVGDYDLWTKENHKNFSLLGDEDKLKRIRVSKIEKSKIELPEPKEDYSEDQEILDKLFSNCFYMKWERNENSYISIVKAGFWDWYNEDKEYKKILLENCGYKLEKLLSKKWIIRKLKN